MTNKLIPFHSGTIEATLHSDGKVYVSVKRVCEHLGLANQPQQAKLSEASWAVITKIVTTGSDGKSYEMMFLEAGCLAFWIATINTKKVAPEIVPLLNAYQREARDVLARHFTPEVAPQQPTPLTATVEEFAMADAIATALRLDGSARLGMIRKAATLWHPKYLPLLPDYAVDAPRTEAGVLIAENGSAEPAFSLTTLLDRHGVTASAVTVNKRLIEKGFLEEKTRKSSRGLKKYKAVTAAGLQYGKNIVSDANPRETQPYWYEASFKLLLEACDIMSTPRMF